MRYLIFIVMFFAVTQGARRRNYNAVLERRYNLTLTSPTTPTNTPSLPSDNAFDLSWTETTTFAPPPGNYYLDPRPYRTERTVDG
jgi:hypothetical protein